MTNYLSDIITYVRRIVKTPSNSILTDALIIDYINRFWMMDVDARIQLFDLKTTYQFQTSPGIDKYNMPLYSVQSQSSSSVESLYDYSLSTADGTATYTAVLLTNLMSTGLVPSTIEIWIGKGTADQTLYLDDGAGTLTAFSGTYTISAGTINYTTGALSLTFTASPPIDTPVMANFQYNTTLTGETVGMYPVYQNMLGSVFINGINMPLYTERSQFYNVWPNYNQMLIQAGTGDGTSGPYTLNLPFIQNSGNVATQINSGIIRGHVDMSGIIDTGQNQDPPLSSDGSYIFNSVGDPRIKSTSIYPGVYFTSVAADGSTVIAADTGIFLTSNQNYGLLMTPGTAPYGNNVLSGGYSTSINTINYQTGVAVVTFDSAIPDGTPIQAQCVYYQTGIPRAVLFYNNTLVFRAPPNTSYLIEIDAYLTPAAFFSTSQSFPYGYMCEYIARGAARKILSDTGDVEQFNFYEPLFKEQESLVWKRSQRQFTATRTPTIYSQMGFPNTYNQGSLGGF